MSVGIGLVEIAGGALIVLGVFAAFMVWAVLPLISFAIIGGAYATIRYGIPALGRSAVYAAQGIAWGVRWMLTPVAVWTLRGAQPAYHYGDGGRRR
ncbi:MAG TPA: hypothetical protein VLC48_06085 [Gemmatimonadota bacterium]|nr:hypothetical protein [Gemmatimonadota bacterium]